MELEVLITLPQRYSNRTCGCYYGNGKVPTTADTIDENPMKTLALLWNGFGYWNNQ
jgi:hypothetical protein